MTHAQARKYRATHNELRNALKSIPRATRHEAIEAAARLYVWQARAIGALGIAFFVLGACLVVWSFAP